MMIVLILVVTDEVRTEIHGVLPKPGEGGSSVVNWDRINSSATINGEDGLDSIYDKTLRI